MILALWLALSIVVVAFGWSVHLVERRRTAALRIYQEHCQQRFLRGERTECPCTACEVARTIWFGPRVG